MDRILCSDSIGLEKPATQLYAWSEKTFDLEGPNLVCVGDNPEKGFYGANQRQWDTVQVGSDDGTKKRFDQEYQAKRTIPLVTDLERIIFQKQKLSFRKRKSVS